MIMEITLQELQILFSGKVQESGYEMYLGKKVFIRSVTHHYTGLVVKVSAMTMLIDKAAWIANDGRFNEAMRDVSKFDEVEMYEKPVSIGLGAILDITEIEKLPDVTK
jgi:hypothetical protein